MCIWDGSPVQPEDEREEEWHDPEDASYSWNDGQGEPDGEDWKETDWPEHLAGPEYYLNKKRRPKDEDT